MKAKRKATKAERAMKSQRASRKRGVAKAADMLMKKLNPGKRITAVRMKRLADGGVSIMPLKVNPGKGPYYVWNGSMRYGPFSSKKEAQQYVAYLRKSGSRGASVSTS